ncbi:MAG: dethiobiotin synthase [Desulfomonilaceae bacterium]
MSGIFITGADTNVGKTIVTTGLTCFLRKLGIDCVALKPVETGCELRNGELFPADGNMLWRASGKSISLDEVTPFRFSLPAAPYRAAVSQDSRLKTSDLVEHIRTIEETHEIVIVEGAGGLFVPIEEKRMFVDLIKELGFPVVLVTRSKLGTINHTMLSVEALVTRKLNISGVILSECDETKGPEEEYTPKDIARMIFPIPFFKLPFLDRSTLDRPAEIGALMEKQWGRDNLLKLSNSDHSIRL